LCGVSRDNWIAVRKFVSDETIVVDLDRNRVMFGQQTMQLPPVPGKKWLKLQNSLQEIAGHLFWRGRGLEAEYHQFVDNKISQSDFKEIAEQKGEQVWKEKLLTLDQAFNLQYTPDSEHISNDTISDETEQNQWDRLQEAFLRFFVALLKDYRKFVHVPDASKLGSPSPTSEDWLDWGKNHKFETDKFIASQKPEYFYYLSELCSTQQFDDFITKRLYSPQLPDVIFFDQSIDAKLNRYRLKLKKVHTPFLQSAQTHKQLETFVAVEPNTSNLPDVAPFVYETWPENFESALFCSPRPIPSMITAEFDRQTSLVKQLQMNHSPSENKSAHLANLYGSDYDYSPEGMSFTVFFFAYSAVIGREWQEYQLKRREIENIIPRDEEGEKLNDQCDEFTCANGQNMECASSQSNLMPGLPQGVCDGVMSGLPQNVCDGVVCPYGEDVIDDCVNYMSSKNPCPDFASDAQAAYDAMASFALSLDPTNGCRNSSLLDDDEGFAEYEEAREVAIAQLDLAFDALNMMEMRGLTTDPDVFKSLMEACGRCGDTKRAIELIEIMKRDSLVADNAVLVYFMASFAHSLSQNEALPSEGNLKTQSPSSDAYFQFLKKKIMKLSDSEGKAYDMPMPYDEESDFSDGLSDSGSELSIENVTSPAFLQVFAPHLTEPKITKKKKRKRKKSALKHLTADLSDRMKKQLILGESLLDFLYPDIHIDTFGDTCPMCSNVMKEEDIVSGWQQCDFQDFTTACPQCSHRFVPRFKVSCSSHTFEGSQGPGTPLYCEFLSPWVLRKELGHIIGNSEGIHQILDPSWRSGRDVRATIWWNLIAMCKRHQLPFSFLLQGSFRNRLIQPSPQD
jgi:pentatricopeptide repeat protein